MGRRNSQSDCAFRVQDLAYLTFLLFVQYSFLVVCRKAPLTSSNRHGEVKQLFCLSAGLLQRDASQYTSTLVII